MTTRTPRIEQFATALTALALVGLIAWADWASGHRYSFSIFYLAPVALVAWQIGRWTAIGIALLAAGAWALADRAAVGIELSWAFGWNAFVRVFFYSVVAWLLDALHCRLTEEQQLADTDSLTGALNARAFYERVDAELTRSQRHERPLAVAYLDLDNFKHVNDERGHEEGDRLLKTIVAELRTACRTSDLVARLGGDEFALLLPEAEAEAAERIAEKLRAVVTSRVSVEGWPVTMSVGVVSVPPGTTTPSAHTVIAAADALMYRVKRGGKDGVAVEKLL